MSRDNRKLLAVGGINGAVEPLERLLTDVSEQPVDAIAVVGDLGAAGTKADVHRAIFTTLGRANIPTFWVPGPADAPLGDYLREAYNMETVFPHLHGLHGTAVDGPGHILYAGMGARSWTTRRPSASRSPSCAIQPGRWSTA